MSKRLRHFLIVLSVCVLGTAHAVGANVISVCPKGGDAPVPCDDCPPLGSAVTGSTPGPDEKPININQIEPAKEGFGK